MTPEELLSRKRKVLLKQDDGRLLAAVIDPFLSGRLTIDRKFIQIGNYNSDQVYGWYPVDKVAEDVISIVTEFD